MTEPSRPEWASGNEPEGETPDEQRPGWASASATEPAPNGDPQWPLRPEREPAPGAPKPPRQRRSFGLARAGAAVALIAAFAGFLGGTLAGNDRPQATVRPSPSTGATAASSQRADFDALYKQVSASVVEVVSAGGRSEGTGSGVIIDGSGIILTNNHVVSGSAIEVILANGSTLAATVAGRDPQQDLAVIRLTNPPAGLIAARLGNSDTVAPGQPVAAIGSPFGFQSSITTGVVSAVNRTFQGNSEYPPMRGLIQTDAAINPGNSGGPLFNLAGEVIGITTAIESPVRGSVGVGFAVPINQAQRALPALVRGDVVAHPFLGIQGQPSPAGGVEVVGITPGSSAAAAGIRAGDVVIAIGGVPVSSVDGIAAEIDRLGIGKRVTLAVRRGSSTLSITVTLRAYQGG